MSDSIKHECGIAFIRLLKPGRLLPEKYGTSFYGLNKMHILMEAAQPGTGRRGEWPTSSCTRNPDAFISTGCVRTEPLRSRIFFSRSTSGSTKRSRRTLEVLQDPLLLKKQVEFTGEIFLGHLRYGTFGKNDIENVHPVSRENNWMTRSLVLAGNFNLTNIDELFDRLIELGQYPPAKTDTVTILERIGHFLDRENDDKYRYFKDKGYSKHDVTGNAGQAHRPQGSIVAVGPPLGRGYAMAGVIGHGDAFIMQGRPESVRRSTIATTRSSSPLQERAVIQTTFNLGYEDIRELTPGHALIVRRDGEVSVDPFTAPRPDPALFVRADLFLAGSDQDIYRERKQARTAIFVPEILKSIDYDIENTVFSYIPNTAESAFSAWSKDWTNTARASVRNIFWKRTAG